MKTKIHIDIGQYEFVEFEFYDAPLDTSETKKMLESLYEIYHKIGDKLMQETPQKRIEQRPKDELLDDLSAI